MLYFSMENHQRSKKHKENLEALKAAMNAEDRAFFNPSAFDNEADQQSEHIRFFANHLDQDDIVCSIHTTPLTDTEGWKIRKK